MRLFQRFVKGCQHCALIHINARRVTLHTDQPKAFERTLALAHAPILRGAWAPHVQNKEIKTSDGCMHARTHAQTYM